MNKNYENNSNKINNRKGNNSTATQEPAQPRSYLADLFKPPADPVDAEAERDANLGHSPRNINANGSLTLK